MRRLRATMSTSMLPKIFFSIESWLTTLSERSVVPREIAIGRPPCVRQGAGKYFQIRTRAHLAQSIQRATMLRIVSTPTRTRAYGSICLRAVGATCKEITAAAVLCGAMLCAQPALRCSAGVAMSIARCSIAAMSAPVQSPPIPHGFIRLLNNFEGKASVS